MDINVFDKCNNRCLMCTNPDWPWPAWDETFNYSYEAIVKRLKQKKKEIEKDDSIYLSGGEPTLHPRFLDIFTYITRNFPKQRIVLLTNGRIFVYEDFAKKLLKINDNFDIDVSLQAPVKQVCDKITKVPGSFEQVVKGLENLLYYKENQSIGIRFVITKLSYKYIANFLNFVKERFPLLNRMIFIFWEVEGQAIKNFEKVSISYKEVRPYLEKIDLPIKSSTDVRFYHFPLCAIPKKLWPYTHRTLNPEDIIFIEKCKNCQGKDYCLGIQKNYLEYMGEKDFKPLNKVKIKPSGNFYRPIDKKL